jgi:PAS domain-containing protein
MLHRWHYRSLRAIAGSAPSRRPSCIGLEDTDSVSTPNRALLERVEDLFVNAPVGFHTGDRDGRILSANRALSLLLGFDDPAACEGILVADLFVDDDVATQLVERVRRGETVTDVEALLRGPDGEPQPASIHVSGRFEDGELLCTRWIARPVHTTPSDADRWAARLMDEVDVRPAIGRMTSDERADRLAELEDFFGHCPASIIAWR